MQRYLCHNCGSAEVIENPYGNGLFSVNWREGGKARRLWFCDAECLKRADLPEINADTPPSGVELGAVEVRGRPGGVPRLEKYASGEALRSALAQ